MTARKAGKKTKIASSFVAKKNYIVKNRILNDNGNLYLKKYFNLRERVSMKGMTRAKIEKIFTEAEEAHRDTRETIANFDETIKYADGVSERARQLIDRAKRIPKIDA